MEPKVVESPRQRKAKKSLGSFFKQSGVAAKGDSSVTFKDAVEAELSSYLLTPSIDTEQDPLAWWNTHRVSIPHLAMLARKYLSIPVPPQRGFSVQVAT